MGIIATLLIIIFVVSSILLVFFVLIQDDQGEGLGGLFGGGSSSPLGTSGNRVLVRITSILGTIFIISSISVAFVTRSTGSDDVLGEARRMSSENTTEWWDDTTNADEGEGDTLVIPSDN